MATVQNTQTTNNQYAQKKIAGNNVDLGNAGNIVTPEMGYNLVNTEGGKFDPNSLNAGDIYLGGVGNGVTQTDIDSMKARGVNVMTGANRGATANYLSNYIKNYGNTDETNNYKGIAADEYQPIYDAKKGSLTNTYNSNLAQLQSLFGGINGNYDNQVANQNLQNTKAKNDITNSAIGHGMSRSSILETGNAEADQENNKAIKDINSNRTNALNNVNSQIATLGTNYNNDLATLDADKLANINTTARELQTAADNKALQEKQLKQANDQFYANLNFEKDWKAKEFAQTVSDTNWTHGFQEKQLASSNANAAADRALQQQQINISAAKAASSGSSKNSNGLTATQQAKQDAKTAENNTMAYLEAWASGKAKDQNGRASRSDIMNYISKIATPLQQNGILNDIKTWADNRFVWDKDDKGNWYKVK